MAAKLMSNTPIITPDYKENIDSYRQLIDSTGEDLNRPGLLDTPARAAKAFSYLTQGYHQSLEEVVNDAVFPSTCLLYTSPSPRDRTRSRMPSSA